MSKASEEPDPREPGSGNLADALAWIAGELGPMKKEQSGEGVPYKFLGIDALQEKLTPLLAQEGITIRPVDADLWSDEAYTTGGGANMRRVLFKVTYAISRGEEAWSATTVGEAADSSDKSANKAQTAALKALYLALFGIATPKDDQDAERPEAGGSRGGGSKKGGGERTPGGASKAAAGLAHRMVKNVLEDQGDPAHALQAISSAITSGELPKGEPPPKIAKEITDGLTAKGEDAIDGLGPAAVSVLIDACKHALGENNEGEGY